MEKKKQSVILFKNVKIKTFVLYGTITLFFISTLSIFLTSYFISKNIITEMALNNLDNILESSSATLNSTLKTASINYLKGLAEVAYDLLKEEYDKTGSIDNAQKILDFLSKIVIGETGYYFVIDLKGNYILSKGRQRDGENIYDAADSSGFYFIREMIARSQTNLTKNPLIIYYPWQNKGEPEPRKKVAVYLYLPDYKWILGASSYLSEFTKFIDLNELKSDFMKQKIGTSGFLTVYNPKGDILIHPLLEGKNILNLTEKDNADAINQILNKDSGILYYPFTINNLKRNVVTKFKKLKELDLICSVTAYIEEINEPLYMLRNISIGILIGILLISFVCLKWISDNILGGLNMIRKKLKNMASETEKADLTKRLYVKKNDEIGDIGKILNVFLEKLNNDIVKVFNATKELSKASERSNNTMNSTINTNIEAIKRNAEVIENQIDASTAGIEELSATLEQMVRSIDSIMNNMQKQGHSVEVSASGIEEMVRNIEAITQTANKSKEISQNLNIKAEEGGKMVKAATKSIQDVADYSQQILKLLQLISNIAKQTNLLAMNAAIEAAHAGEAGKGFAIVADEIRRLSEDTNKNARDIGEVVNSIVNRISESVNLAIKAGEGLDMILSYSQENSNIINQLTITMEEQNNGAKNVLHATEELVHITEEVKQSMKEQKQSIDEFNNALREIRDLALKNKEIIKNYMMSLRYLSAGIEEMKSSITDVKKISQILNEVADRFILQNTNTTNEPTSLKLVE